MQGNRLPSGAAGGGLGAGRGPAERQNEELAGMRRLLQALADRAML